MSILVFSRQEPNETHMRTFDETYYQDIALKGTRPIVPKHDDPTDYGLTREDAIRARLRYLRPLLKKEQCIFNLCQHSILNKYDEWVELQLVESGKQLDMLRNKIMSETSRLRRPGCKSFSYDIARIKQIPIDTITEIMPNRFFRNNPFRTENSPSNSLYYYKDQNRFHDFMNGKNGDVIDFYMADRKCSINTALKELSQMI